MAGRPLLYPTKKVIGFSQEMLEEIDDWRRHQKPIPSESDAIRRLIEFGLQSKGQEVGTRALGATKKKR
jgi:regulatory protein YycI of two-component signal transduction system YycFG